MDKIFSFLTMGMKKKYDVTFFQTPRYGDEQGYSPVYQFHIDGKNHEEVLENSFRTFNVADLIPFDFSARLMTTGDIIYINEGKQEHFYRLESGGWKKIKREYVR
ncbi:hypothetical protein J2S13_000819 [Oikeobacillus pervagus]|uniref:YodL-like domain-containing protein n=1 Tax=Oikeobacillus pervagus TaxID=1325931 RepID=A0AAJ1WIK0_9BACI|nr:YodL domain-containing protein [Oikeobacillus pervagus]MDQ0214423.1 hypothetical protein [Oikeobacillus pervagus]